MLGALLGYHICNPYFYALGYLSIRICFSCIQQPGNLQQLRHGGSLFLSHVKEAQIWRSGWAGSGDVTVLLYHPQHLACFLKVASWSKTAAGALPSFPYSRQQREKEKKGMSPSLEEASRKPHITFSLGFTWPEHTTRSSREAGNGCPLAGGRAAFYELRRKGWPISDGQRPGSTAGACHYCRTLTTPAPCTCWPCPPP